jgi:hypothetical protein
MRRADVFFYGLFMDQELLRAKGLTPQDLERAAVDGLAAKLRTLAERVGLPAEYVATLQ